MAFMLDGRDDPKQPGDSGEVPISEWSGWRFDSRYEIFSLLDGTRIATWVGSQEPTHCKVGIEPHHAPRRFLNMVGPTGSNSRWLGLPNIDHLFIYVG